MPGRPWRQVRDHQIGWPAQGFLEGVFGAFFGEIELQLDRAGDGLDLQKVDAGHMRGPALERGLGGGWPARGVRREFAWLGRLKRGC